MEADVLPLLDAVLLLAASTSRTLHTFTLVSFGIDAASFARSRNLWNLLLRLATSRGALVFESLTWCLSNRMVDLASFRIVKTGG